MTDSEDYLSSIYFDPKHPTSFAGSSKLYHELKKDARLIGLSKIKQWVQNQDITVFTDHKGENLRKTELLYQVQMSNGM